jgi:hypothetical protein
MAVVVRLAWRNIDVRNGSFTSFRLYLDVRFVPNNDRMRTFENGRDVPGTDILHYSGTVCALSKRSELHQVFSDDYVA